MNGLGGKIERDLIFLLLIAESRDLMLECHNERWFMGSVVAYLFFSCFPLFLLINIEHECCCVSGLSSYIVTFLCFLCLAL